MKPDRQDFSPIDLSQLLLDNEGSHPLHVLLLEDNELDAFIFKKAATQCSRPLVVTTVETLAQFKATLHEEIPHLICADHILPDGVALEAISYVKKQCPEVPFIVITGAGEEELAAEYLREGAADYLSKRRLDLFPMALDDVLERFKNKILREKAEKETLRINKELLALVRHVEEERDDEKRALSRDIHDQLGQELTALKLGLFWIQKKLNEVENPAALQELHAKIDDLVELNTGTIQSVRNLAHSLRPVILDHVGLSAGLESLVRDFNRRRLCFCGLHCSELPQLSEGMRTDVFRIVQEALTNIARHADASIAYVRLQPEKDGLLLEVGDNGKGMLMAKHGDDEITGLGMVGMRERARNHQGAISVDSQPNKGTSISVYFPTITLD